MQGIISTNYHMIRTVFPPATISVVFSSAGPSRVARNRLDFYTSPFRCIERGRLIQGRIWKEFCSSGTLNIGGNERKKEKKHAGFVECNKT